MRWIPVTERLPNESGSYLVTVPMDNGDSYVDALDYHKGKFYEYDSEWGDIEYDDVLAWMPLPKPYKADRKTEPQTCSVNGRPYDCGNCEYFKCTADEPQTEVIMPKKCEGCDSASKIIEAYSKGFEDGADAVKAMPQADCNGCKFVGTYDTEFPCVNCSRKTKDYYDKEEWYTYQDEQEYNDRWQTERSE